MRIRGAMKVMNHLHGGVFIFLGLAVVLLSAQPAKSRMAIACSPFVYPCQCGLCPHIVDCTTKLSAECFCGMSKPGIYSHPQDNTKFWMCSFDKRAQVHYGVEVQCPARLLFDPVIKVCTLPDALTPSSTAAHKPNNSLHELKQVGAMQQGLNNRKELSSSRSSTPPGAPKLTAGKAVVIVDEKAAAYRKPLGI